MSRYSDTSTFAGYIRRKADWWCLTTLFSCTIVRLLLDAVERFSFLAPVNRFFMTPTGALIRQMCYTALTFSVLYMLTARLTGERTFPKLRSETVTAREAVPFVMFGIGITLIINNLSGIAISILDIFGLHISSPSLPIPDGIGGNLLYILTLAVLPAVFEELAFRGLMLPALRKCGDGFAILATGLMFGLMHGNLAQAPFAFAVGLVFGWVAVVTDSYLPSVIVHGANNLLAALTAIVLEHFGQFGAAIFSLLFVSPFIALGGVGAIMLVTKQRNKALAPLKKPLAFSTGKRLGVFCLSVGFICAAIYFGGEICLSLLRS